MSGPRRAAGPLLVIALAAAALAALDASGQSFWQGLAINLAIFMILTVALNLTSGFTGVFSLGQIGFMALGAYVSAILTLPLPEKASYLPNKTLVRANPNVVLPTPLGPATMTISAPAELVTTSNACSSTVRMNGWRILTSDLK